MRCMSWVWPCRWVPIFSRTHGTWVTWPKRWSNLAPRSRDKRSPNYGNPRKNCLRSITGWGLTYPSEKYESVGMIIPNLWKNKTWSKPPTRLLFIPFLPTTPISLTPPPEALESGQNTTNSWRIPQMPPGEVANLAAPWADFGFPLRWLENPTNQWKFGWELHENWEFSSHAWWRVTRWCHW